MSQATDHVQKCIDEILDQFLEFEVVGRRAGKRQSQSTRIATNGKKYPSAPKRPFPRARAKGEATKNQYAELQTEEGEIGGVNGHNTQ